MQTEPPARAVDGIAEFPKIAREIYNACKRFIGASAGYVALRSKDGTLNELLFLDEGPYDCRLDPELPMPVRGLRAEAYKSRQVTIENNFTECEHVHLLPQGHVTLENVMFAPMVIEGRVVGLFGLSNKPGGFTDQDAEAALSFGEMLARALTNSFEHQRLEARANLWRKMFDLSPAVQLLIDPDGGQIVAANDAACDFYGYGREQLESMSIVDINILPPEQVRVKMGRVMAGDSDHFHFRHLVADGQVKDVEVFSCQVQALEKTLLYSVISDISEYKHNEANLVRLSRAIEQSTEMVVITDLDGNITYVNPAFEQTTGYSWSEAVGQNPRILKSGQQPDEYYADLWDTIRRGESWNGRFVNRRKDGSLYTEEARISPVQDENGANIAYVAVKHDVTKERDLEQRLQQAERFEAVGALAGEMAHEVNNLLATIMVTASMLKQTNATGGPSVDQFDTILSACQRGRTLTSDLLSIAGKRVAKTSVFDLNQVVEELFGPMVEGSRANIGLDISLHPRPLLIEANQQLVARALANICTNSIEAVIACRDQGLLQVTTSLDLEDQGQLGIARVEIRDNGAGMDEETLSHALDPFFTRKRKLAGAGLGLSIANGTFRSYGGMIELESTSGEGTTIRVSLPLASAAGAAARSDGPARGGPL